MLFHRRRADTRVQRLQTHRGRQGSCTGLVQGQADITHFQHWKKKETKGGETTHTSYERDFTYSFFTVGALTPEDRDFDSPWQRRNHLKASAEQEATCSLCLSGKIIVLTGRSSRQESELKNQLMELYCLQD